MIKPPPSHTLTHEYAMLSLRTGLLCGAADKHLGRRHFELLARAFAWELTEERLQKWRAEAIAMGVPARSLPRAKREES